jgi:hypothetical protein
MPHNNRVSSSSALKMTGIWKDTIGYDPYAGAGDGAAVETAEEKDSAYEQAQGLMALARLTNQGVTEKRGACKKCGMVGHLTFQCRNHLQAVPDASVSANAGDLDSLSSDSDDVSVSDVSLSSDDERGKAERKRHRSPSPSRADEEKRKGSSSSKRHKKKHKKEKKSKHKKEKKHKKDKRKR